MSNLLFGALVTLVGGVIELNFSPELAKFFFAISIFLCLVEIAWHVAEYFGIDFDKNLLEAKGDATNEANTKAKKGRS